MASKGQQFKKYTNEERIKIVQEYLNNMVTPTMLSKKYNISIKTIWNWIVNTNQKDIIYQIIAQNLAEIEKKKILIIKKDMKY